ncbi:hypothetical protein SAMN05660463_00913 [Pseudomonas sp. URIL14HWK12:I9]|nr:hypothetical protein F474_00491 [Pseudomonas sp. URIL14HWK12:I12]PVZ26966.1 hypothetical protein F470_00146 [Pseudomonas sp. URIL14HWK12:I10]PVZ37855.1 hypothetical protein F472_00491 [Pseudomonas sp. URIL14HWK12:I11]SNZ05397.1 hypothetical protein SAMN05660463_00913 [Pseudomonas sp. URIL14HWK12:I9]
MAIHPSIGITCIGKHVRRACIFLPFKTTPTISQHEGRMIMRRSDFQAPNPFLLYSLWCQQTRSCDVQGISLHAIRPRRPRLARPWDASKLPISRTQACCWATRRRRSPSAFIVGSGLSPRLRSEIVSEVRPKRCFISAQRKTPQALACGVLWGGGRGRNRTGVDGFAIRLLPQQLLGKNSESPALPGQKPIVLYIHSCLFGTSGVPGMSHGLTWTSTALGRPSPIARLSLAK